MPYYEGETEEQDRFLPMNQEAGRSQGDAQDTVADHLPAVQPDLEVKLGNQERVPDTEETSPGSSGGKKEGAAVPMDIVKGTPPRLGELTVTENRIEDAGGLVGKRQTSANIQMGSQPAMGDSKAPAECKYQVGEKEANILMPESFAFEDCQQDGSSDEEGQTCSPPLEISVAKKKGKHKVNVEPNPAQPIKSKVPVDQKAGSAKPGRTMKAPALKKVQAKKKAVPKQKAGKGNAGLEHTQATPAPEGLSRVVQQKGVKVAAKKAGKQVQKDAPGWLTDNTAGVVQISIL